MRFTAVTQAVVVVEIEDGLAAAEDGLGAGDGASEWIAFEMAFCGTGKVVVPDIVEGGIEADSLEAMVEANGPVLLAGKRGKGDLGEVLEVRDLIGARRKGAGHSRLDGAQVRGEATWSSGPKPRLCAKRFQTSVGSAPPEAWS